MGKIMLLYVLGGEEDFITIVDLPNVNSRVGICSSDTCVDATITEQEGIDSGLGMNSKEYSVTFSSQSSRSDTMTGKFSFFIDTMLFSVRNPLRPIVIYSTNSPDIFRKSTYHFFKLHSQLLMVHIIVFIG